MRNKITRNQIHSGKTPTQNERWHRWKRFTGTLAVCAAAGLLTSCGTQDQNYRRESSRVMEVRRDPSTREALLEWIRLAEDTGAGSESRLKAKGSLMSAALDGELSRDNLDLVAEFFVRNAASDLEEIRLSCVHGIGILGERNSEYAGMSVAVFEQVMGVSRDTADVMNEAIARMRDIGRSENGQRYLRRIIGILEMAFYTQEIAENAVYALSEIVQHEGVSDLERENIIEVLFRATEYTALICPVWVSLEDISSSENITLSPQAMEMIEWMDREVNYTYEGVSCSEWFSE